MLGKHPDLYPRFRDCFVDQENRRIVVLTRVGGGNRNEGYGEEELYQDPNFVKTYDADWDSTYGYYEFNVPQKWESDFDKLLKEEKPSDAYIQQMCEVFPKLKDKFIEYLSDEKRKEAEK